MGKLPKNMSLVRIDRETWKEWCKFCEKNGYLASKWAGFKLKAYMKEHGWEEFVKKQSDKQIAEKIDDAILGDQE